MKEIICAHAHSLIHVYHRSSLQLKGGIHMHRPQQKRIYSGLRHLLLLKPLIPGFLVSVPGRRSNEEGIYTIKLSS